MENQAKFRKALSLNPRFSYWVLTLIPLVYLIFVVVKYSVDVPFWDQWQLVPLLEKSYKGTLSFHDLWARHNEHIIFFPRIIMIVLAHLSGWNIRYEMAVNVLLGAGLFFAIIYQIRMTVRSIGSHGTNWVIPVVSFIVFSLNQVENWLWGMQIVVFLNVFAVVTGIVLLADPVFKWLRFVLALVLGIVASYSFGNGLLYWCIGLFILLFVHANNREIIKLSVVLWVIAGFIICYLYLYDYKPNQPSLFRVIVEQPVESISYVFSYLGAPLLTFSNRLHEVPIINKVPFCNEGASVVGSLGLFVSCYTCWLLIRLRCIKFQALVPYISLGLYAIGSALLTGLGRAHFGYTQALSSRYITVSSLFWISNVIFLYLLYLAVKNKRLELDLYKKKRLKQYALFSIAIIVFLVALSSAHRSVSASNTHHYLLASRNEILSLKEGDPYVPLKPVYPCADIVEKRLPILKKYHLSLFRNLGPYLGPRVTNAKVEPDTVLCDGSGTTLITASVSDPDGDFDGSISITVDLTWQIFRNQRMYDDGTHGDVERGDGVYSYLAAIPEVVPDGPKTLLITATDDAGNTGVGPVRLSVIDPDAIYVDNSDAEFTCDDWIVMCGITDAAYAYGLDFCLHRPGDGSCTATWRPDIPRVGKYNVYAWWPTEFQHRAMDVKFTVHYDGGINTKTVSQMIMGSRWNYLGTYCFAVGKSGRVVLSNDANGHVIADAIKWKRVSVE